MRHKPTVAITIAMSGESVPIAKGKLLEPKAKTALGMDLEGINNNRSMMTGDEVLRKRASP